MKKNHAKTYPSLALGLASKVLGAVSGSSTSDSFASFDPATWSLRTSQHSLLGDWIPSSVALPKAGTMRSGSLYELPTLERPIGESGSSSSRGGSTWDRGEYPTPTAEQYGSSQNGATSGHVRPTNGTPSLSTWARKSWTTPKASDAKRGDCSSERARNTPSLVSQAPAWATPTAQDWRSGKASEATHAKNARPLSEQVGKLWPTATAQDAKASGAAAYSTDSGRHSGTTLTDAAVRQPKWATPRASDGEKGGPNARDGSGSPHLSNMAVNMSGLPAPETPKRGRPTSSDTPAGLPLWEASSIPDS